MEASLILCRFDPIYGPKIFLKAPKSLKEEEIKKIPTLMEIRPDGFFIHIFENLKTANLFFKISSAYARGGKEGFLISIVTNINSELKLMWAKELLESFAQNLINLEEAYKAFDYETKNYIGDQNKLSEIENLFFSFFKSITPAIKTLEIAEQRYQTLFKTARDAIFIINKDAGIIIDVNLEAEKLVESSRDEIIGLKPSQLQIIIPEMLELNNSKYLNRHYNTPNFTQLKKSNGKMIFIETNVNEIQLGDQNLLQFVLHDITERITSERMIEEHAKNIAILNKIIIVISQAKNLSELMNNVLDYIMGFLNFDGCCVYLINELTRIAKIEAYKGLISDFTNKNTSLNVDNDLYNIIFIKGIAIFNETYPEIINKLLEGTKFSSLAIIPLFSSFEIIGAICVILQCQKEFTNDERDLFILIGLQLGTAIEKMKNEEVLHYNEVKYNYLLSKIPLSILRIANDGILLDASIYKDLEKIIIPENLLGKNIFKSLPDAAAKELNYYIKIALEKNEFQVKNLTLSIGNMVVNLQIYIDPIESKEVLVFLMKKQ